MNVVWGLAIHRLQMDNPPEQPFFDLREPASATPGCCNIAIQWLRWIWATLYHPGTPGIPADEEAGDFNYVWVREDVCWNFATNIAVLDKIGGTASRDDLGGGFELTIESPGGFTDSLLAEIPGARVSYSEGTLTFLLRGWDDYSPAGESNVYMTEGTVEVGAVDSITIVGTAGTPFYWWGNDTNAPDWGTAPIWVQKLEYTVNGTQVLTSGSTSSIPTPLRSNHLWSWLAYHYDPGSWDMGELVMVDGVATYPDAVYNWAGFAAHYHDVPVYVYPGCAAAKDFAVPSTPAGRTHDFSELSISGDLIGWAGLLHGAGSTDEIPGSTNYIYAGGPWTLRESSHYGAYDGGGGGGGGGGGT